MAEKKITSVYDLLRSRFGVDVDAGENFPLSSVGTTAVVIAKNNPRRLSLVVINLSANTLYVRPQGIPTSSAGILLSPNGGSLSVSVDEDMHLASLEWQAVASGAGSAIYVTGAQIG